MIRHLKEGHGRLLDFKPDTGELLLRLQLKDVQYKLKGFVYFEGLLARDKLPHLNHLQIEHVVDEAEEQIHLTYEQED